MRIVPRSEWGFDHWLNNTTPPAVALSQRTEFFVHYDGGVAVGFKRGPGIPLGIHRFHRDVRGWAGIGYNFVVAQDGAIYEGRGWALKGSHVTNHNTTGLGVQVHIGGDETPSAAALAAVRWLYDQATLKTGRQLAKKGHRDGMSTSCPGDRLYAWVRAGMPAPKVPAPTLPTTTTTGEPEMTKSELQAALTEWAKSTAGALAIQRAVWGAGTYGDPDQDGDRDRPIDMLHGVAKAIAAEQKADQ